MQLHVIEYIVVFWLKDILVSTTTQRDGSHQQNKSVIMTPTKIIAMNHKSFPQVLCWRSCIGLLHILILQTKLPTLLR